MIAELLPPEVVAVEARGDSLDFELFPEEEAALGQAVEKRRREFTTARACAHSALERLGLPAQAIPAGSRGEPLWPAGVVGSITHTTNYRACALARASNELIALGIDAEPNAALPDGVLAAISLPQERIMLQGLARVAPAVHWERLLFSAKECVYKTWFPLAARPLGFEDAELDIDPHQGFHQGFDIDPHQGFDIDPHQGFDIDPHQGFDIDPHQGSFSASLLVAGPLLVDGPLRRLSGRWLVRDGLLLTAIALRTGKRPRSRQ